MRIIRGKRKIIQKYPISFRSDGSVKKYRIVLPDRGTELKIWRELNEKRK